ncbi:RlpA-like double-psi beta-barrel domain-containing protein [Methylobacterium sp. A49B]
MGRTAAIWDVPFNTRLRVTHLATGRSIVVRVNDRGPHRRLGRLIDLSTGSCRALGACGLARVRVEIVSPGRRVADAR